MRTIKTFIFLISILLILFFHAEAQNVEIIGDTIEIVSTGQLQGTIQWQFSNDKINWKDIAGENNIILKHRVT